MPVYSDTQSCLTLCDPTDCGPPGPSALGFFQARILEWVAAPSSRGSSRPRDGTHITSSLLLPVELFTADAAWRRLPKMNPVHIFELVSLVKFTYAPSQVSSFLSLPF